MSELEKVLIQKNEKLNKLKKESKKEEINYKNSNKKLFDYFINLEQKNKIDEETHIKRLSNIKQDIEEDNITQKEKDKILNILISIFNLLYKNLNLQRDIIENPKNIDLIKSDYIPQIYLTEEILNYINLMLHNSTDESCGLLLREIVSYGNMILKGKDIKFTKIKYDPIKTVQEIEKYIGIIKGKNKSLNNDIEILKTENKKEREKIKTLNSQIIQINKMYDALNYILKMIYINESNKEKKIKKCFSDNYLTCNIINKKSIDDYENNKRFIYLRKYLEGKKNSEILFSEGANKLIGHINRLFFYKNQCDIKPKDIGVFVNAHRRMQNKFCKLKKLKINKYTTIENALTININENLDKLIFKIHQEEN